ncbi:pyridoxamine 5'-phosphate oxidase family protein [Catalinimonas sp. 4WD22]|uniref:pyridoxamine 5'-phosphate oxidase family protein n=1 Tax=Catalinimonas locisalis TaxID=3133978 RepID=UPI00310185F5
MIEKESTLEEILAHVWGTLARGGADAKHAFHFPVLATCTNNEVRQRTLVLRETDIQKRQLICFSDVRTQKVSDIKVNNNVNWLFYDHQHKEQVRASARSTIHHMDELSDKYWKNIPPKNRGDYLGPKAPGSIENHYSANLPEDFLDGPTEKNTAVGRENFCVIVSEVNKLDFLKLMKGGHLRTLFTWNSNNWEKNWLAP